MQKQVERARFECKDKWNGQGLCVKRSGTEKICALH